MANYHIDGPSGSGKTTVSEELRKRGYNAIDADEVVAYFGDPKTGEPQEVTPRERFKDNWIWNKKETNELLANSNGTYFVCGGASNYEEFSLHFKKTFILLIDDETLKYRLLNRTNNDFGKHPDELAMQLEWNQKVAKHAKEKGYIIIDATKPVEQVVDEILQYVSEK